MGFENSYDGACEDKADEFEVRNNSKLNPVKEFTKKSYEIDRARVIAEEQGNGRRVIGGNDVRYIRNALNAHTVEDFLKVI
jgi:hypothetical protein